MPDHHYRWSDKDLSPVTERAGKAARNDSNMEAMREAADTDHGTQKEGHWAESGDQFEIFQELLNRHKEQLERTRREETTGGSRLLLPLSASWPQSEIRVL